MDRTAIILRATCLLGGLFAVLAVPVDRETIIAIVGDGCGQILYPRLMDWLGNLALLGSIAAFFAILVVFIAPRQNFHYFAAIALWEAIAIAFLAMYLTNHAVIYNCDTFGMPSNFALLIEIGRVVVGGAILALACQLPKRDRKS